MIRNIILCACALSLIASCVGSQNPADFTNSKIFSIDVSVINYSPYEEKILKAVIDHLRDKGYQAEKGIIAEKQYNFVNSFYKDIRSSSKADAIMILDITLSMAKIIDSSMLEYVELGPSCKSFKKSFTVDPENPGKTVYLDEFPVGASMQYWIFDNSTGKGIFRVDWRKAKNTYNQIKEYISCRTLEKMFPSTRRISSRELMKRLPDWKIIECGGGDLCTLSGERYDFIPTLIGEVFYNLPKS